jgi:sigma-B regulation protein RsbU (phosphoserine phosphatase)
MAVVRTVFRIEARRRIFPAETLYSVNMALQAERSFGMVTMLYAFVDPTTSTLHVANAGHNFPIILNGTMDEVRLPGLPLGIDDSVEYDERQVKIAPGTSVIFYTDGVIEAMDSNGEMYGFENFRDAVLRYQNLESRDFLDEIFKEISDFTQGAPQSDDITVLILQYARVESEEISPEDYGQKVDEMFASVNKVPVEEEASLEGFEEESVNWI